MEISRFPNKLKLFRHSKGYSRKKVARFLGLTDSSSLSRWERGVALPALLQVFSLARIYQTQPHELFDDLWKQVGADINLLANDGKPYTSNPSSFL
jgi:transcriptional regulator with XRE-family HTH domain